MTSIRLLILCNDEKASAKHATSYYEQIFMSARRARRFLLKLIARCSNPRLCKAILALANEWLLAELEPHLVFLAICLLVPVPKRTFQKFSRLVLHFRCLVSAFLLKPISIQWSRHLAENRKADMSKKWSKSKRDWVSPRIR